MFFAQRIVARRLKGESIAAEGSALADGSVTRVTGLRPAYWSCWWHRTHLAVVSHVALWALGVLMEMSVMGADVVVIDSAAEGKRFDGIGAVSGGGATSVLLKMIRQRQCVILRRG